MGIIIVISAPIYLLFFLVDSRSRKVEIYHKENDKWIYDAFEDTAEIILNSPDAQISFADVYMDVEFEADAENS